MASQLEITEQRKEDAEKEIREKAKSVEHRTFEYPVEAIVQKYLDGIEDDENEIFIPNYQREMSWDEDRQSKFIESLMLGLPIPYIFVADVSDSLGSEDLARLEIIDGTQRIRTLTKFIKNELKLRNLNKLESLNGFTFKDLPLSRQRRFNRISIRMIQLTREADEEVRRDLFERINTGSVELNEMEKRRGIYRGKFLNLVEELSKDQLFIDLCSFSKTEINKRDPQEFILRFFAFLDNYQNYGNFDNKIHKFLDEYLKQENESDEANIHGMKKEFYSMLEFVKKYFPDSLHIYRKTKKCYEPTTRIKFESITVGIALAMRKEPNLKPKSTYFLESDEFKKVTKSDASSSQNKVTRRIEYVRDQLLGDS